MNTDKTKTTRGRQKIEIKKIENIGNRQVTFTKRRGGLFKKAAELCVMTGADVAIIVKSPGGRTFAFGHPCVGTVVERYLGGGEGLPESAATEDITRAFGRQYDDVAEELAAEKRRGDMIAGSDVPNNGFWWEEPMDGVGAEELDAYVAALEELKKKVTMRADEMMMLMNASNNISMQSSNSMLGINTNIMNPISSENSSSHDLAYQPHDSTFSNSWEQR